MSGRPGRPVPQPTAISQPFWDACLEHRLVIQQCATCEAHLCIPQAFCRRCWSTDLRWVESAGTGTVETFTVVWRPQSSAFDVPYIVAVVRLDEGVEMMTNLVEVAAEDVSIGAAVRVRFVNLTPGSVLPCFTIDADRAGA